LYALIAISCVTAVSIESHPQSSAKTLEESPLQSVIIDTDIGGDIDDVYAVGLALQSQELKILGIMTEFEDIALRATLVARWVRLF
jgi:purine nucleosidase